MLERFADLVSQYGLRLTVFATGKVLEQQWNAVESFQGMGAEIELHGHDHVLDPEVAVRELSRGLAAYRERFGTVPLGYRAPGGVVSSALLQEVAKAGIKYDSSIIPSFRLGMYSNLGSSTAPHCHPGLPLVEMPVGVVPGVRLLIATSYIRLLGLGSYKVLLSLLGRPPLIVYLFHMVDLIPVTMRRRLPPFLRYAYLRGEGNSMQVFEASVRYFETVGYRPSHMSQVYKEYAAMHSEVCMEGKH